jgi:hypothetical protein
VIDERVKYRVICPKCNTSRNVKLLPTKNIQHENGNFYLLCDNPACTQMRMVTKEGDELGIEPIKARLDKDGQLMGQIAKMHGVSKIYLRNSIPKDKVAEHYDDYEMTPEYHYSVDGSGNVQVTEKPWEVLNDEGVACNSLMPPPVVVALIKQLVKVLGL